MAFKNVRQYGHLLGRGLEKIPHSCSYLRFPFHDYTEGVRAICKQCPNRPRIRERRSAVVNLGHSGKCLVRVWLSPYAENVPHRGRSNTKCIPTTHPYITSCNCPPSLLSVPLLCLCKSIGTRTVMPGPTMT